MRAALIVAAVLLSNQANAKPLETGDRAFFLYLPIADTCAKILPLETVQKRFLLTNEGAAMAQQTAELVGWLHGYATATSAYHKKSAHHLPIKLPPAGIMNWLFSFCRHDPAADFMTILNAFNKSWLKIEP